MHNTLINISQPTYLFPSPAEFVKHILLAPPMAIAALWNQGLYHRSKCSFSEDVSSQNLYSYVLFQWCTRRYQHHWKYYYIGRYNYYYINNITDDTLDTGFTYSTVSLLNIIYVNCLNCARPSFHKRFVGLYLRSCKRKYWFYVRNYHLITSHFFHI